MTRIAVVAADAGLERQAQAIARRLGVPCMGAPKTPASGLALMVGSSGLSLQAEGMCLRVDFTRELPRLKEGVVQRELLVRAAKVRGAENPLVVDATAGLGEDSLLLAAAGFEVLLFESDPVIALLLRDGLERAAGDPGLAPIVDRLSLVESDSIAALPSLSRVPDVVYLDPMFPQKVKAAAPKKKFQLLHLLERPCDDEESLLEAALSANPSKVVIKRPLRGPFLGGRKPSYSLAGKAVRFDVLALPHT